MDGTDISQLRNTIATACCVLGHLGLARETTGHISARVDVDRMLIRCRDSNEAGIVFTAPEVVREVDFDGKDQEGDAEFETPSELPIHGEILRRRPDITAVVHCHPRASMIFSIRKVLEKAAQYSFEQGLTPRPIKLEELFAPSVVEQYVTALDDTHPQ